MSTTSINNENKSNQIISAISSVVEKIKLDPNQSHRQFKANALLNNGLQSNINVRQFSLTADEPQNLGGDD